MKVDLSLLHKPKKAIQSKFLLSNKKMCSQNKIICSQKKPALLKKILNHNIVLFSRKYFKCSGTSLFSCCQYRGVSLKNMEGCCVDTQPHVSPRYMLQDYQLFNACNMQQDANSSPCHPHRNISLEQRAESKSNLPMGTPCFSRVRPDTCKLNQQIFVSRAQGFLSAHFFILRAKVFNLRAESFSQNFFLFA